jgi:alkanesulfonate monooxygenase SsuD/methylene tetrahydromethanopterin reductase-like flavin-dependent oxidoreductase (luciferase family)
MCGAVRATRPRIGVVCLPTWAPELLRPVAHAAEDTGLDELWLWEDCFKAAGPASASAALAWTDRICVGIGLMPAPLRNVATTAMEIAALERHFPGRFIPVIGHGVQDWMGQIGARAESPLTLLREYAIALRRLLDGETVSVDGRYVRLDGVRLDWPSPGPSRLLIGGEGPKTLALAAELGDGTMLTSALTESQIVASADAVRAAGAAAGHEIVAHLMVTRGPDARALLDAELRDWGRPPEAGIAAAAPGEVAEVIDRVAAAGASTVIVNGVTAEPDPVGLTTWIGREVLPLVGR